MLCKQCWLWRQAVGDVDRALADREKYRGHLLRQKHKSPTVEKLLQTVDDPQNYRLSRRKRLIEIGDTECPHGRCILCDFDKEVNDGVSQD